MDGYLAPPKMAQFTMTRSIQKYGECELTLLSKEKNNSLALHMQLCWCLCLTCNTRRKRWINYGCRIEIALFCRVTKVKTFVVERTA